MAGFLLKRDENGRLTLKLQGCCGNLDAWQREYDRAYAEQQAAKAAAKPRD